MRWFFFLTLIALLFVEGVVTSSARAKEAQVVESVDLVRYMGKWYEIAAFPMWFERGCTCSAAEYTLQGDTVLVRNSCRKDSPDGKLKTATAKAWAVKGTNNAKLKVQFFWPFRADYWIIALDADYRFAMVGHPKRKYLWILSRTPVMDERLYRELVETAKAKGYEVGKLRPTVQTCE
jgi:apolipoprotein D and lipocalin family protein